MRWLWLLPVLWLGFSGAAREAVALFYEPAPALWLEEPAARERLVELFAARGVRTETAATPAEYLERETRLKPAWIIYGPCETVSSELIETVHRQLRDGARLITGAGMPFWYEVNDAGIVADGAGVGERVAEIVPGFLSGEAAVTPFGERLLQTASPQEGYSRGFAATEGSDAVHMPLVKNGDNTAVGIVLYPGGGKFFFAGTPSLSRGLLNILTPEGLELWRRLLDALDAAYPDLRLEESRREWVIGQDAAIPLQAVIANPSADPLTARGRWTARREERFGGNPVPAWYGEWQEWRLPPGGEVKVSGEWRLPDAAGWGVYALGFESADGVTAERYVQVLPPAAVDYLDVHPLFAAPGTPRRFSAGVYGFSEGFAGTLRLEREDAGIVAEVPVTAVRGILPVDLPEQAVDADTRFRAVLLDGDGQVVHDTVIRVSTAEDNPAFGRETVLFRALDGIQFEVENPVIFQDLLELQERYPLFRGLQPGGLRPGVRDWMREHGFTLNYGSMLNDFHRMEAWGLDDRNAAGVSAAKLMIGHCEDPARWLVRQNSRARFAYITEEEPEIANLIEAVAGYETPGLYGSEERGGRSVSHFFGFAPDSIPRQAEALAGIDGGVRQLEIGGRDFRRLTLPELYFQIYNQPLPDPARFGWKDWSEYRPLELNQAHQHGVLAGDEALRFRLHYFVRHYLHMKRLDDLSGWLHAYAGEVHNVAHEGPLIAQISSQFFRLPYVDTNTVWLFRSAWQHGFGVNEGPLQYWLDYSALFRHRYGLHEEIGGGQWASYRTAETSFVSVFTKRATIPFSDLQVDFYLARDRAYRVREETAMYRGFQLAVDSGARPAAVPRVAVLGASSVYHPELKQAVIRDEPKYAPTILRFENLLRQLGIPFRSVASPLLTPELLHGCDLLVVTSEHLMAGDMETIAAWLNEPGSSGRAVIFNHAGAWNLDYSGGFAADAMRFNPDLKPLELLIPDCGAPGRKKSQALNGRKLPQPMTMFYLPPPAVSRALAVDEDGIPVVWTAPVGGNTLIYSGIPLGNILNANDPEGVIRDLWSRLLTDSGYEATLTVTPAEWFAAGYFLNGDRLALAAIHPGETAIANRDYGVTGDGVEKAAAELGVTPVEIRWRKAAEPGSRWRLTDAWTGEDSGIAVTAGPDGDLTFKLELPIAKLYILERQ